MKSRRAWPVATRAIGMLIVVALLSGCGGGATQKDRRDPALEVATHVRQAQGHLRTGRMGEALEHIRAAIRLDPDNAGLHNFHGLILFSAGQHGEAETAFRKALELDPYLTDALNNLGALYNEMGREDEAERTWFEALEDSAYPTPEKVRLHLGELYASQGRDDDALVQFRQAVELNPKYLKAHYKLAGLLDRSGKLEEALREYEVAEPGYRSSGEFHYRLGLLYQRLGDPDKAAEHLRRVGELSPGSEAAVKADEILKTL